MDERVVPRSEGKTFFVGEIPFSPILVDSSLDMSWNRDIKLIWFELFKGEILRSLGPQPKLNSVLRELYKFISRELRLRSIVAGSSDDICCILGGRTLVELAMVPAAVPLIGINAL